MDKIILEIVIAIREIKDILSIHSKEIEKLKKLILEKNDTEEKLIKLVLDPKIHTTEDTLKKKVKELETAIGELSEKLEKKDPTFIEISRKDDEEPLNRLRKVLAE